MARYRKRPVVVEAFHYQGPSEAFDAWCREQGHEGHITDGIEPCGDWGQPVVIGGRGHGPRSVGPPRYPVQVLTTQGQWVRVTEGEWIVCDSQPHRFYPVADEVFRRTYDGPLGDLPDDYDDD